MGRTAPADNANTGYRAGGARRPRGRSKFLRALSDPAVRLGYGVSLAGMCVVGLAVWLTGPVGLLLVPAPLGILALAALRHLIVAIDIH
jgi:hypothetical protein